MAYFVTLIQQLCLFWLGYRLIYISFEALGYAFTLGAERHFRASIFVFVLATVFQWFTTAILKGKLRFLLATLNLLLAGGIIFHRERLITSLIILFCMLISVLAGQILYRRQFIKSKEDGEAPNRPDILDEGL